MNRRDTELLDALLLKLTAHFGGEEKRMSIAISRGEGRAVVAAIRERDGLRAAEVETQEAKGPLL
jgi:hypothetical protein